MSLAVCNMRPRIARLTPVTAVPDSSASLEWHAMVKPDLTRRCLALALSTGALFDSAASGGETVDVWVELTEAPPDPAAAASQARQQRDLVALQQDRVGRALFGLGAIELARVRTSGNAIAVRIDRSRLDAVRALDGVKRVRPARALHPPRTGGDT